ncbi:MAG: hypothetical protein M0R03_16880 [Novosphingobium sp.]|nr:hypothetical protein [Novosphingobium sp.]
MLTKLQFRPGVNRETTAYTNEGGWFDVNRVRFRAGHPETVGGWVKESQTQFLGTARALVDWRTLDGTDLIGIGTNLKYYVNRGGTYVDITPVRLTSAAGDATFSASAGSTELTVQHTGHGAQAGDFVRFSAATSLGGAVTAAVLNQEFQVASVVDGNNYTVELPVAATAADSSGGGSATIAEYDIRVGLDTTVSGVGWGAGGWGVPGWGQASDISIPGEQLRMWSHTNYGEDLVYAPRGGAIYYWDWSTGLSARGVNIASLSGANKPPTRANIVMLSEQDRHLLVFGTDDEFTPGVLDPLLIRFSSQESLTDWESRPNNTAGSLRVSSGGEIVAAVRTRHVALVLTNTSASTVQYIGPPFTFGLSEVASGITVAGPNAAVSIGDEVLWMGRGEFYRYDGLVRQIPSSVRSYVFDDINEGQYEKVFAGHNSGFGEVWWFYPSAGSEANDRYVAYDYTNDLWFYGELARTAWVDRGVSRAPVAASADGYLYLHETGITDGEFSPPRHLGAYIESSPVDIGDGDHFMFVSRVLPDIAFTRSVGANTPSAELTLKTQNFSGGHFTRDNARTLRQTATVPIEQFTEQVYVRLRGRSVVARVASHCDCTAWRLGSLRLDLRPDGRRG